MKSIHTHVRAIAALMLITFPLISAAQASDAQGNAPSPSRYTFYDVGTLSGGSSSYIFNFDAYGGNFTPSPLNSSGQIAGSSLVGYASELAASFSWSQGRLAPLPTLPGGILYAGGSNANGINNSGMVVGASAYGHLSPYNGQNFYHAVSWTNGRVTDLGDLGGGESWANFVNNHGLVVGFADNGTPDPYSYYGVQYRAAVWQNGVIRDLGTLGGTDSEAWTANDNGQVVGIAFLDTPPVPPFNQPQADAFLWSNGTMQDLGTLGGGYASPSSINHSGQVTVISFDATNQRLGSYLWNAGQKTVLNGLGGNFVEATMLNDAGTMTGASTIAGDSTFIAELWRPSGLGLRLGTVFGDTGSIGLGINNSGVIVGGSGSVSLSGNQYAHAFVWRGGRIQDLNTLIPAGSSLTLNVAYAINDGGVIAGLGTTSTGNVHVFVLVPQGGADDDAGFISAASAPAAPGSVIRMPPPMRRPSQMAR